MTTTYCNAFVCLPTTGTGQAVLPFDAETQIPVEVLYAIYTQDGSEKIQIHDDNATVSLVVDSILSGNVHLSLIWKGTAYAEGTDLVDLDWKYSTTPSPNVLKGSGGCKGIPPADDHLTYTKTVLYLSHKYATPDDIQNFTDENNLAAAIFPFGVCIKSGTNTWYTTTTKVTVQNTTNKTASLTVYDGTPTLTPYLAVVNGTNAIYANNSASINIELDFQIYTDVAQGGSGKPLTIQNSDSPTCKLIVATDGQDLDGYTSGELKLYGQWKVKSDGVDTSFTYGGLNPCSGCNASGLLQGEKSSNSFWVYHTSSYVKQQSVSIAMWVSYQPDGASDPIIWATDRNTSSPQNCCVNLFALAQPVEGANVEAESA